jgi:hypothetical protein
MIKNKRLKQGLNTSYNILMEQYRGEKKDCSILFHPELPMGLQTRFQGG